MVGCGTIATEIANSIATGTVPADLSVVYGHHSDRIAKIRDQFQPKNSPRDAETIADVTDTDLVIEAAGQKAVDEIVVDALEEGCSCLLMSVGALADEDLRSEVIDTAAASSGRIYLPSGAIAGLDAIKAAGNAGELESVSLQTTKPPAGLEGAPYFEDNDITLKSIEGRTVVFEGAANKAATAFPSNINIAMALSLAGIGPDETTVRIVADPNEESNIHRITADGGVGRIETEVRNVPSPSNPKTSYLAALSAIEKLRSLTTTVEVGT